jgi:hypothetical protein
MLGAYERYNVARNYVRFYNNVGMTATYEFPASRFRTASLKDCIFAALHKVIARHPVLSLSIADEASTTPSFIRLAKFDLEEIVSFDKVKRASVNEYVERAHRQPFEDLERLPLWRLIVIERERESTETALVDVGFFWHHVIGDGESGVTFHMDLLKALESTPIGDSSPIVVTRHQELLPPIEYAIPLPLSFWYKLKILFRMLFPSNPDSTLWTGPPICAENNTTHLRTLFLSQPQVDALRLKCRKHNVTITALLLVLIAKVLGEMYPDNPHFTSKTAISLRRFAKVEGEMVGYVTSLRHYFSSKREKGQIYCGDVTWEAIREAREDILTATKSSKNQSLGLLKYLKDPIGWFRKQPGSKRPDSFEISNLGVVGEEAGEIRMKRMIFSQSSNVIGPAYVFSVVTLKNGEMSIGLTWQEDIVTTASAEKLLENLKRELENISSDE